MSECMSGASETSFSKSRINRICRQSSKRARETGSTIEGIQRPIEGILQLKVKKQQPLLKFEHVGMEGSQCWCRLLYDRPYSQHAEKITSF